MWKGQSHWIMEWRHSVSRYWDTSSSISRWYAHILFSLSTSVARWWRRSFILCYSVGAKRKYTLWDYVSCIRIFAPTDAKSQDNTHSIVCHCPWTGSHPLYYYLLSTLKRSSDNVTLVVKYFQYRRIQFFRWSHSNIEMFIDRYGSSSLLILNLKKKISMKVWFLVNSSSVIIREDTR